MKNRVVCDLCGENYTHSELKGGFLFGSNMVCPECATDFLKTIKECDEEHYIKARAFQNETFRDFVYRIRSYNEIILN